MDLYKEIMIKLLECSNIQVTFSNMKVNSETVLELTCYQILKKVKAVIEDDSLNDKECFNKIEKIICILEKEGIPCGDRHDF